jgi:exosortase D (VPLPA-CTERM-specific)
VPVYLEGNVIDLGVTMLQVAEACSGLRYLFPIMSFTYVFAVLYRGPLWQKLVLLLLAVPVAVTMNAVRIGIIGILVDRYGVAQAEGFLHVFEGWVVFLSCLAILFGMAKAMKRIVGDRRPLGEALDLDFSGLGAQVARIRFLPPSPALATAALMTAALGLAWSLVPARATAPSPREPYALFPRELGPWSGSTQTLKPGIARILGADDYFSALYARPGETAAVDLFLSYYVSQTDGTQIHSPEVCLPGAGWEVFRIEPVTVALPGTRTGKVALNRAVIQKGLERQLVYYWFQARGRQFTGDFAARFANITDSLTLGRTDGGLVRVITAIGDDGVAAADARLQRFLTVRVDRLPHFIPE